MESSSFDGENVLFVWAPGINDFNPDTLLPASKFVPCAEKFELDPNEFAEALVLCRWLVCEKEDVTPAFFVAARDAGITPNIKSASSALQSPEPPAAVSKDVAVLLFACVSSVKVNSATFEIDK